MILTEISAVKDYRCSFNGGFSFEVGKKTPHTRNILDFIAFKVTGN